MAMGMGTGITIMTMGTGITIMTMDIMTIRTAMHMVIPIRTDRVEKSSWNGTSWRTTTGLPSAIGAILKQKTLSR